MIISIPYSTMFYIDYYLGIVDNPAASMGKEYSDKVYPELRERIRYTREEAGNSGAKEGITLVPFDCTADEWEAMLRYTLNYDTTNSTGDAKRMRLLLLDSLREYELPAAVEKAMMAEA